MGLFDFLRKKKKPDDHDQNGMQKVLVDNTYLLEIPSDWKPFKSDRFRTKNKDGRIRFSATTFSKPLEKENPFTFAELKSQTFEMFAQFVSEGGFVPVNDREAVSNFVYQAFTVENETQYYYHKSCELKGLVIRIALVLKESAPYKQSTKNLLLTIGESMMFKVA